MVVTLREVDLVNIVVIRVMKHRQVMDITFEVSAMYGMLIIVVTVCLRLIEIIGHILATIETTFVVMNI